MSGIVKVLGFDYGGRIIGVAFGTSLTASASAVGTVGNGANGPDWPAIDRLLGDWRPDLLVVGLPLSLDGGEQATSKRARAFAGLLGERSALPVQLVDERMSSQEAARQFAAARRQGSARAKHAANADAMAARVIVEQFLREGGL